jgi:hypothetical protein
MNRGYVILAGNELEYQQAAACAYSIRSRNKNESVSLIVPAINKVPDNILEPFENLIELPFTKLENTRMNDWQLYWATPYEYTIAVDCRCLIKENHEFLWEYLTEHYDICFPGKTINFDGKQTLNTKTQVYTKEYNLTVLNSQIFYFKKDADLALRYFKMADPYMRNWQTAFAKHFAPQHVTTEYSSDIMHSLISECADVDVQSHHSDTFLYIDMNKAHLDGMIGRWDKWTDRLNVWASRDGKIKIQNFAINNILYYREDDFLTKEIFNEQRDHYRTVTK